MIEDNKATFAIRYAISGGVIIYISIIIFHGDDNNKQYDKEIIKKCDSGDFVKDWYHATEYMIRYMKKYTIIYSSGIGDFINLSNQYEKIYLKKYNNNWTLFRDINNGYTFYILKGTSPTWDELKQQCTDEKKE
jgi:hypothetical protein